MRAARHPAGRARLRHQRLVTPQQVGRIYTVSQHERDVTRTGLAYAALIQRHFPAFYNAHVGRRALTAYTLYGVVNAFFGLVHRDLFTLDLKPWRHVQTKRPEYGFEHGTSDGRADQAILRARDWLEYPQLRLYGLTRDLNLLNPTENLPSPHGGPPRRARWMGAHALATAVWLLTAEGPWSRFAPAVLHTHACQFDHTLTRQLLTHTNGLTPPTPLSRLCARLDHAQPHGVKRLGSILAYICGRTGNGFADTAPDEVDIQNAHGVGVAVEVQWTRPTAELQTTGARQRWARQLQQAYQRLDRRCHANPELLGHICNSIRQTAGELLRMVDVTQSDRGGTYDPTALIHQLPEQLLVTTEDIYAEAHW